MSRMREFAQDRHLFRWAITISVILSVVTILPNLIGAIRDYQKAKADRAVVWNEVSYPQGNIGTVVPDEVSPGDTITVTFKEYCNKGVNIHITRWLEFLDAEGSPIAAYGLAPLEFYSTPPGIGCVKNLPQPVTISPSVSGRPLGTNDVRLRLEISYVKPEQVIRVPAYSEPFRLLNTP